MTLIASNHLALDNALYYNLQSALIINPNYHSTFSLKAINSQQLFSFSFLPLLWHMYGTILLKDCSSNLYPLLISIFIKIGLKNLYSTVLSSGIRGFIWTLNFMSLDRISPLIIPGTLVILMSSWLSWPATQSLTDSVCCYSTGINRPFSHSLPICIQTRYPLPIHCK